MHFIQQIPNDTWKSPVGGVIRDGNNISFDVVFRYTQPDDEQEFGAYSIEIPDRSADGTIPTSDAPPIIPDYIKTMSNPLYNEFQRNIATGGFSTPEGRQWPMADLSTPNKRLIAVAEQKPREMEQGIFYDDSQLATWKERMQEEVSKMDDETADVLDALVCIWIERAKTEESYIHISSDDGLRLRGLKPKKNSRGYGNQFTPEQYKSWAMHLSILGNSVITINLMDCYEVKQDKRGRDYVKKGRAIGHESPAIDLSRERLGQLNLSGNIDIGNNVIWKYKMGSVFAHYFFGPGKQYAYIHRQTLGYNPDKQQWEKRFLRYFAWQWRIRQQKGNYMDPYKVDTLLAYAKKTMDPYNPTKTKDRFEKALDTLQRDKVINAWQYEPGWDENIVGKRGWAAVWKEAKISVEPPDQIMEHYTKSLPSARVPKNLPAPAKNITFAMITEERKNRSLSIMQAAEQIGISTGALSVAERGGKMGKRVATKIEKWIQNK